MSRLDELIEKLCPDGVEWKELGELCGFKRGQSIKSTNAVGGEVPVISGGQKPAFYHNVSNRNGNCITVAGSGAYAGFVSYWDKPIFCADSFTVDIRDYSILSVKYTYYFLKNKQDLIYSLKKGAGVAHVYGRDISNIKIPILPLEIQEEIVHILDLFTELTAELTARRKQYEFYRDSLLTFGDDIERVKLKDIATIKARIGWQGLTKEEYLIDGKYQLITGVNFVNGSVDFSKCYFVSEERYLQDKNIQIKEKDILVTKDGTLGKIAYINKLIKPSTLNSGIFVVRCNDESVVLSKYLFYYLRSPKLMNFARSRLTGGTIKHLNQNVIIEFPVCVPSLPEQERIVSILDKFDKLCNDISEGLPAEIDARKKQYEYYRDKLLTFKNISEHKD